MFRDRLRQWGMNDKNRRSAARPGRRALRSERNEDRTSRHGPHYDAISRTSSPPDVLYRENIHNLLQTSKETLVLQRTLKGVLDWYQHTEGLMVELDHSQDNTLTFVNLIHDMTQCLYVSCVNPYSCEKTTSKLWRASAELRRHFGVTCTPSAVLFALDALSSLACNQATNRWYYETARFIVNAAVEEFPVTHPSLLLIHLLFSEFTPSQLVMMYDLGSNVIEQCYGEARAFSFRVGMYSAASRMGLDAIIRSYDDALCAATPDTTDSRYLFDIARLCFSMGRYEESEVAVRRCLVQLEDEVDGDCSTSIDALQLLAVVQCSQNDFVGEEVTLHNIVKITLVRDRRELHTPQLSIDALDAISELDAFYAYYNINEKRDALRLEYPGAFEL